MGGSGSPDVPKPSREERELIAAQTNLLRQAQAQTEEGLRQQNLLNPLLFEQFGIRPTVFEGDTAPDFGATTQPVNIGEGIFTRGPQTIGAAVGGGGAAPGAAGSNAPFMPFENVTFLDPEHERVFAAAERAGLQLQSMGGPLRFVQSGGGGPVQIPGMVGNEIQFAEQGTFTPGAPLPVATGAGDGPSIGDIVGFEEIPDTPEELLRQDLERGFLERTQAALSGDLPVDPALERSIADREAQLRQRLFQQLGPGFETSSPGMEALSRFRRDVEQLRGSARRADLTTSAGLSEAFTTGRERSRALDVAGIQDILGASMGGARQLGTVAQAFQSPIGALAGQRNLEFQGNVAGAQAAAQQEQSIGQLLGMLAGGGLGFAFGGPAGALTGASLLGGGGSITPSLVRGR